ncbi:hypothetical protein Hanom_Chr04g00346871 [Helianthus anomalus]
MISILEMISIRDDKHSRDDKYSNRSGPNAAPDRYEDYHFRKIGSNVYAYFGSGVSLPKYSHSKMPLAVHLLMLLVKVVDPIGVSTWQMVVHHLIR